jgi:Asp-tRNA(Asn)/Glu-tRNA(Gln) amidotransferase A subunit family amidase
MQTHGKPIGSLHGLPISVKEHVGMKDLDLNAGFVSWVGRTAKEDAHILQILWDAGAVFYARTTQPQSLMHLETNSNLYEYLIVISVPLLCVANFYYRMTVNPFNTSLTSGGSSGGEGALLGMRGSCMALVLTLVVPHALQPRAMAFTVSNQPHIDYQYPGGPRSWQDKSRSSLVLGHYLQA